jgi:hypothetical protein
MLNCANPARSADEIVDPDLRNGRVLNQGTIASEWTYPEYYLRLETQAVPVDLYGPVEGARQKELLDAFRGLYGQVAYHGVVDLHELARIRRNYAYSIVIWSPHEERGLYAPSNKFFEAIADGVPPITAPHPQHKMLVERYRCGIVMSDWSFESFHGAIRQAMAIFGTDRYREMVENCRRAVVQELNWDAQFAKVTPCLPPL